MKGSGRLPADFSLCRSHSAKHLRCKLNKVPPPLFTDALTICCKHLIAACRRRNLKPHENCDEANNEEVEQGCVRMPGGGKRRLGEYYRLSSELGFFFFISNLNGSSNLKSIKTREKKKNSLKERSVRKSRSAGVQQVS